MSIFIIISLCISLLAILLFYLTKQTEQVFLQIDSLLFLIPIANLLFLAIGFGLIFEHKDTTLPRFKKLIHFVLLFSPLLSLTLLYFI